MNIHLIAIGGSAMHNLALELHKKGYQVTGSDDEIFEPSKSRLEAAGLLPEKWGWYPERITSRLDAVILGMHAREDNPELQKAQELGIPIYSYPEYLYEQTKNKLRVIVGGSHGKTNTTKVVKKGEKGAKRAELYYEVLDVMDTDDGTLSYVLIELVTGRHHQIRAQFASRGCGIWGDTKYNPKFAKTKRKYKQIGLFSSRMEFTHPITGEEIVIKKEPEGEAFEVLDLDEFE